MFTLETSAAINGQVIKQTNRQQVTVSYQFTHY